jgi:MFS family permease
MVRNQDSLHTRETKPVIFYGYIIAIASALILLVTYGMRFSYGIFFTPMAGELGWNSATTSLAFSISMIVEGIFNVALGAITDRYGPRVVLTISGILMGAGYCLMFLVNSTWQFYLFYGLIIGAGMGGIFVPLIAVIARWFSSKRGLMTGTVLSGAGLGVLIMAPLSNRMIEILNWRETFLVMGIVLLIVITVAAQFLRSNPSAMGLAPDGEVVSKTQNSIPSGFSLKEAVRKYQLWFILLMYFVYGFSSTSINVHLVPDAIGAGISAAVAATILATMGGIQLIGRIGLGLLGDRIGNKFIFIIGFILAILSLFWAVLNHATWAFFVFAIFFGLAQGGISTSQSPLIAGLFGLKSHGLIFGFCGLGFTIGSALGPFLTGHFYDITHSYDLAFIICAITSAAGLIFTLFLKPLKNTASKDHQV